MRDEYNSIRRLLYKREAILDQAESLSSPQFGGSGGGEKNVAAPYEGDVLTAADLESKIDKAMLEFVNALEDTNRAILNQSSGQRQRVCRLRFIAGDSIRVIADLLDVTTQTVRNRLDDVGEECVKDVRRLYLADERVERHIAWVYRTLCQEIGTRYVEVNALILAHERLADAHHAKYEESVARERSVVAGLTGMERAVVEARMKGSTWEEVGSAAGCTPRHARRVYRSFVENQSLILL